MRESPRQPSNLEPEDESQLAWYGHRMEQWEAMKNKIVPLEERRQKMIADTERELQALTEKDEDGINPEQDMLIMDLDHLDALEGDEETITDICDDKIAYYKKARHITLEDISKKHR
ncbi:MAG: hypothetical protein AAB804_03400 [Patescibacteria group bacterium]